MIAQILAQVPEVNTTTALIIYGPMGIQLAWFMLRFEKLIKEVRNLAHRIDGFTRAQLIEVLSRDSCGPEARQFAHGMLAQIEERDRQSKEKE